MSRKIVRKGGTVTLPEGKNSEAIYEAILTLDESPENYTAMGSPRVDVIEALTDLSISEEERDLVWEAIIDGEAS